MKTFLTTLILFVGYSAMSQRYFEIILDTTASDSCAVGVSLKRHNLTNTSQFVYGIPEPSFRLISNSSVLTNVCKGTKIIVSTMDSNCVALESRIYINPNSSKQIKLDTVIIVMPSAPGACDGSLTFKFKKVTPFDTRSFGSSSSGGGTTDSVFTGLCEDMYFYGITIPGHTSYDYYIPVDLNLSTPPFCNPFDVTVDMLPSASPGCDGSLVATPNEGSISDYGYYVFNYCCTVNPSSSANYANNLCSGPYSLYVESPGNSYKYLQRAYYVDTVLADSSWGAPPIVSPTTDTILIPSIFNCSLDYTTPLDTVYLDQIEYVGGGVYEFFVMIVQGADTITLNESAIIDTNNNFFIDVTVYCDDSTLSTRAGSGATGALRNMIYHGDQTVSSNDQIRELNSILIYPNPANNRLNVSSNLNVLNQVELLNLNLQSVIAVSPRSKTVEIDISNLPQATYIIKFIDDLGNVGFSRFVKI